MKPHADIESNATSFARSLRARNLSPKTEKSYLEALRQFDVFLAEHDMPREVARIEKSHVEAFINDQLERWSSATAGNRYRSVQAFFKWLVLEEEELERSPMDRMKPPKQDQHVPAVLRDEEIAALVAVVEWNSRQMLQRYAASSAAERAQAAHRKLSPSDKF